MSSKYQSKTALITDNKTISWNGYKSLVQSNLSRSLKKRVINQNTKRAIIIAENSWELFILFSCLGSCKIAYSGIDYSMPDEKKIAAIQRSHSNLVFYSKQNEPSVTMKEQLPDVNFVPISIISDDKFPIQTNLQEAIDNLNHKDSITSFAFSSGTTGLPKCIYRTSSFDKRRLAKLTQLYDFNCKDNFLVTLPFYHVSVTGWARLTLVNGGTVIFGDFNNVDDLRYKISNYNITTMLITPPVLKKLNKRLEETKFKNTSVRFIMVGGKNFPATLKEQTIDIFGKVVNEYYGSSETGINTLANSSDMLLHPFSSGRCMEGSKVIILNNDNIPVKNGNIGRIAVASYQNAAGYFNKEMTKVVIDNDEYILTSDYGYMDNSGYLFVVQRVVFDDNKYTTNVFQLENNLRLVKGVNDAVVFQQEDNTFLIQIALENNITNLKLSLINDLITKIIEETGIKYSIEYTKEINYSMSGKVKYAELIKEAGA